MLARDAGDTAGATSCRDLKVTHQQVFSPGLHTRSAGVRGEKPVSVKLGANSCSKQGGAQGVQGQEHWEPQCPLALVWGNGFMEKPRDSEKPWWPEPGVSPKGLLPRKEHL